MSNASQHIVNKPSNFAHVLRDDGLSYMAYTEQITFLLFLKMADEQTTKYGWESLLTRWRPTCGTLEKTKKPRRKERKHDHRDHA